MEGGRRYGSLKEWLDAHERGALAWLVRETGLAAQTIDRVRKGMPVLKGTAEKISEATGGEVPVDCIPQTKSGIDRFAA